MYPQTNAYSRSVCTVIVLLGLAGSNSTVIAQSATRDLSTYTEPGVPFTVSIALDIPSATYFAIEDHPPQGWSDIANISHSGTFESGNHAVKWDDLDIPFDDTLTYEVTPPLTPGAFQCFEGTYNINGLYYVDIEGDACIPRLIPTVSAWGMIVLTLLLLTAGSLLFAHRTHHHRA